MADQQPDSTISWHELRKNYRAAREGVFLNAGSRGIISAATEAAVQAAFAAEVAILLPEPSFPQQLIETRAAFEQLLRAPSGTAAVTKNTSEGLNAIASAIDWKRGDSIVISSDVEHANNVYLWLNLAARGVELRDIPAKGDAIDAERVAEAIDASTRLVSVTAVSFVPGFRTDIAPISAACREHDAILLVDGVQACGVLDVDVGRDGISALATSTSKGLLGLRGLGLLFVAPEWISRLRPVYVARNSVESGGRHYSEFEADRFEFSSDARRFEWGTYNYLGVAAARNAIREINAIGTDRIEARVKHLAATLATGLAELGLPVVTPPDEAARTHLITVGRRGAGDAETTGDPRLDAVAAALNAADIRFAIRRGLLRFGFHFYNDESDVERVLDIARKATQRVSA